MYYNPNTAYNGLTKLNGNYYYIENSKVLTNQFVYNDSYAGSDGKLVKGWKQIDGYWYYFGDDYEYVTGVQKIGGKQYIFDIYGRMIP